MRLLILSIIVLFAACKPDKHEDPKPAEGFISKGKGVFICNEGNFQFGNATVSFYNAEKNEVSGDIFKSTNNRPLGDVCQSMTIDGELAYIVVNNSTRVEVVKLPGFNSVGTINSLPSPRYLLKVGPAKAYVTNYYSNHISVVNTASNSVSGQIPCYGWTEQLLMLDNKVYAVNIKTRYLYIIDPQTDQLVDSINAGALVSGIAVDKNKQIWVSCFADKNNGIAPSLRRIAPVSKTVTLNIPLPDINVSPSALCINGDRDTLFYLYNGVFKMPVTASTAPASVFISQGSKVFYGLGIDPANADVYVSDAIDYVQKGKIYRYYRGGTLRAEFNAGIIPGNFCFY